jgi:hypothetical protein
LNQFRFVESNCRIGSVYEKRTTNICRFCLAPFSNRNLESFGGPIHCTRPLVRNVCDGFGARHQLHVSSRRTRERTWSTRLRKLLCLHSLVPRKNKRKIGFTRFPRAQEAFNTTKLVNAELGESQRDSPILLEITKILVMLQKATSGGNVKAAIVSLLQYSEAL